MESSRKKIANVQKAIKMVFECSPSVPNWCRMCKFLGEYVLIATQLNDVGMFETNAFKQAFGYLRLPPKRLPIGQTASDEEWNKMNYYDDNERVAMTEAFDSLIMRLSEWAVSLDGDEEDEGRQDASKIVPKKIWHLRSLKGAMDIFKAPLGKYVFRAQPLVLLCEAMMVKPISPNLDMTYLPQMKEDEPVSSYEREMLAAAQDIKQGVRILASDAKAEGRGRARAGRQGEIEQEDEVQRRYRSAGERGLRAFVAQVLREPQWFRSDGHPNTEQGRQRCYNRVYALENPIRRAKKKM